MTRLYTLPAVASLLLLASVAHAGQAQPSGRLQLKPSKTTLSVYCGTNFQQYDYATVVASNTGKGPLTITSTSITGGPVFSIVANACTSGLVLAPAAACNIQVRYAPVNKTTVSAELTVTSTGGNQTVKFSGRCQAPYSP